MTLNEFIILWNGKYCEVAGSANAKNQCVDLANAYIRDVLRLPIIEWTNAVDFPSKAGDKYEWIPNAPTNVPLEGDIVIWGGGVGHIAVFIDGDMNRFNSFDQNYPIGSPCHIQGHTYSNVRGWLRIKKGAIITQPIAQEITWQTRIPQILDDAGKPMEVQAIDSELKDLRRNNTSAEASLKRIRDDAAKLVLDFDAYKKAHPEEETVVEVTTTIYPKPVEPVFSGLFVTLLQGLKKHWPF